MQWYFGGWGIFNFQDMACTMPDQINPPSFGFGFDATIGILHKVLISLMRIFFVQFLDVVGHRNDVQCRQPFPPSRLIRNDEDEEE